MALINDIHSIINFATDKGVTGYHKPEDIDNEVHAVSTNLWQKFYDEYARTKKISSYMSPFEIKDTVTINTSGDGVMAVDMEHPTLALSGTTEVEILERYQWGAALNDDVAPANADYPIMLFASRLASGFYNIEARPTSLTSLTIYGLRKPKKAVWTYTIGTDGRRVFDETATNPDGSTFQEIEWSELLFDDIRNRVLKVMGINLREIEVATFAKQALESETE